MKNRHPLLPVLAGCFALWGCDSDKATGTMDETNQSAAANLYMPDLSPASGAIVQAWKSDDSTRTPVAMTVASDDGRFDLGVLPDGFYRVVARKDGFVAMQDSVPTAAGRLVARNDTLATPTVAKGIVRMTGSDNPATVTVLVMGTDILANVEKDGSFRIAGLAEGTYRLRLSSTLAHYTTTAATVHVSRADTSDVGTIRMNFTGIPPVDSLRARFDSTTGRILLSWILPDVDGFRYARVYRERLDGSTKAVAIGVSTSNTYEDAEPNYGPGAIQWLYTVRIHTMDGDSGYPAWITTTQKAVARIDNFVHATISGYDPSSRDSLAPGSVLTASVWIRSSPGRPKSLTWSFQDRSGGFAVDSIEADTDSSLFGIRLKLDSTKGSSVFGVRMVTQDGRILFDSIDVRVRTPRDSTADSTLRDSSAAIDSSHLDSLPPPVDSTGIDSAQVAKTLLRPMRIASWRETGVRALATSPLDRVRAPFQGRTASDPDELTESVIHFDEEA